MSSANRQIALEQRAIREGLDRYYETLVKDRAKDREFDGTVGRRLVTKAMNDLVPAVRRFQKTCRQRVVRSMTIGQRTQGWEMSAYALPAPVIAYATIRAVLSGRAHGSSVQQLGRQIGTLCNLELRWSMARRQEAKEARADSRRNRIELLKRTVKAVNPRSVSKWLRQLDDLETEIWSNEIRVRLGANLVVLLVDTCPDIFTLRDITVSTKRGYTHKRTVELTEEVTRWLEACHEIAADESPLLYPMIVPPKNWAWDKKEQRHVGGYLTIPLDIVKAGRWRHSADLPGGGIVSKKVLDALNGISRTAWRINAPVYSAARQAYEQGAGDLLPVAPSRELPEYIPKDVWANMDADARRKHKDLRREIHDHNNKLEAKRAALRRQLRIAQQFVEEDKVYFPHNLDFRGRAYPLPQDLHPQADDLGRSLLMFADAKPLGETGLAWLVYHTANTFGYDRAGRQEQFDWVKEHLQDIHDVATDPLGAGREFLVAADEPWQFLAAAIELDAAFSCPHGPENYWSSLPVHVDGTCNGLQHLSAMGRDPAGAFATNLTAHPERQDIYQIVADRVAEDVRWDYDSDRAQGDPRLAGARNWLGRVDRKVVKRGVMTVPYGLTDIGMRDQLISDGWCESLEGDRRANAGYLRDRMKEAIGATVSKATEIMAWMQDNAVILAKNGRPVDWRTPSGFIVRQAYNKLVMKRVRTLVGVAEYRNRPTYTLYDERKGDLHVRRQQLAVAPNIIHSFDAAHMMLTVRRAAEAGISSIAVVHDSFGTHAADMDEFSRYLREEFVGIYKRDWFQSLQDDFQNVVGADVPLVAPPDIGDFDITEVLRAEFFFA